MHTKFQVSSSYSLAGILDSYIVYAYYYDTNYKDLKILDCYYVEAWQRMILFHIMSTVKVG